MVNRRGREARADPIMSRQPILAAKIVAPPRRAVAVERSALFARLDRGLTTRLTVVTAPPGFGKTTLLAAKLALLSRDWAPRSQGVCIISHTNAARTEVEDHIAKHATASRLMIYPHFTGTVTAFINQFIALPYLRGLGWSVRQIDDDAFAVEALRRYPSFWALKAQAQRASATVEKWVTCLDLDPDFADDGAEPASLSVRHRKGQHGPLTNCGKALATLKAGMVKNGLYRYADMTALAWRALRTTPGLADRLRELQLCPRRRGGDRECDEPPDPFRAPPSSW